MAYTNSANVKFPTADLIIEEDGSGNVTKVFNRTNNKDYVYPVNTATLKVNNLTSTSRTLYIVGLASGYLIYSSISAIPAGGDKTGSPALGTVLSTAAGTKLTLVSGDFEVLDARRWVIFSDGEINIEDE